jgi:AcrR family transcriptional regulator
VAVPPARAQAPLPPDVETDPLARIVAAARVCFRDRGVGKTRMGEIATGAGMARQTLYDFVANKTEIVDLALAARIAELAHVVRERMETTTEVPIEERLVEVLACCVEVSRDDPEFVWLAGGMDERHAFQYLAAPSRLTDAMVGISQPFLDVAREAGIVRDDVPVRAMMVWLQSMVATLAARDDLGATELRDTLRAFALPAVLRSSA